MPRCQTRLFESEIFGYERGAFTGAPGQKTRPPRTLANEGTLFLDEIGDMSFIAQAGSARARGAAGSNVRRTKSIGVDFPDLGNQSSARNSSCAMGASAKISTTASTRFAIRLPSLRERPVDIPVFRPATRALYRLAGTAARRQDVHA